MERTGVDKALVWLQPPYRRDIYESNAYVFHSAKTYPDKILGFGWADTSLGVNHARDTVKKCCYEYGFFGVKLNGAQNSFCIDDPELSMPVIEEIARAGRILALHVGADAYDFTHPYMVAKIAKRFPELTILMVHMGGAGLPDLSNSAIETAGECPNTVLVGSSVNPVAVLKAVKALGPGRVCYGSDTPFGLMHVEKAKYDALLDGEVSEEGKGMIMGGNLLRVLGAS